MNHSSNTPAALTQGLASKVKELLVEGTPLLDITRETGVNSAYISYIRQGYFAPEVPWPDGSTGAMNSNCKAERNTNRKLLKGRMDKAQDQSAIETFENVEEIDQDAILPNINNGKNSIDVSIRDVKKKLISLRAVPEFAQWAGNNPKRWVALANTAFSFHLSRAEDWTVPNLPFGTIWKTINYLHEE